MAKYIINNGHMLKSETSISLHTLQNDVGGPIEPIILMGNRIMIVDEEGKMKQKEINRCATLIANLDGIEDVIAGTAVILTAETYHAFINS